MQQTLWNIFVILIRGLSPRVPVFRGLSPRVQELPKSNSWGRKLSGHGFYGANLSPGVCPHLHNSQFMHYIFHMENLVIYTDGGCSGNPGPGGWGTVIIDGENLTKLSGGKKQTTNNRMELSAAINALEAVVKNTEWRSRHVEVYSDSQYVKNGITSWIKNWKKNGWKTAAKKPVLNQDLWIALDTLYNQLDIEWKWVKGHAGVEYNEICDQLCKMEMEKFQN